MPHLEKTQWLTNALTADGSPITWDEPAFISMSTIRTEVPIYPKQRPCSLSCGSPPSMVATPAIFVPSTMVPQSPRGAHEGVPPPLPTMVPLPSFKVRAENQSVNRYTTDDLTAGRLATSGLESHEAEQVTNHRKLNETPGAVISKLSCDVPQLVRQAEKGAFEKVRALLDAGHEPNQLDDFQLTALHVAAKKGHDRVALLLLSSGACANARAEALLGQTPLHYACKYGHENLVHILFDFRADPQIATRDGVTPLDIAKQKKRCGIEAILSPLLDTCDVASTVSLSSCSHAQSTCSDD